MCLNLINIIYTTIPIFIFASSDELTPSRWSAVEFQRPKRNTDKTIFDDSSCIEVKERLCHHVKENDDLLILECLYSLNPNVLSSLNDDCHHAVWNHTNSIIHNNNVKEVLLQTCRSDLSNLDCSVNTLSDVPGSYLKCIVNNKEGIRDLDCVTQVERLENVAFYDFKWIGSFLKSCNNIIKKLNCGRLDVNSLTQAGTITCLQNNLVSVPEDCRREIFRLAEIQADNIKFDHQLYLACGEDYMKYCQQFVPGSGRIFKCLLQHRADKLTSQCHNQLMRREKLISQDYKISRGLMRACREDIRKTHCRRQTSDDRTIRLAQILLCLESVVHNGTKIDPDCEAELVEHRKILMEDFRLSPEIVDGCSKEISEYCPALEVGGKTIHCLMGHLRLKNKHSVGPVCQRALEDLIKQADVGEDWRVDPVLHEACNPVVKTVCHDVRGGNARVISCLMNNIGADHMTEECEDALMQIQYFVARDFKLDPQLYHACREDAGHLCHAGNDWEDNKSNQEPSSGPLVLPCLYRYMDHENKDVQLKQACREQIQRVMRQRAVSVDLQPEVEEVCLDDLSLFCYDKTAKGEEMQCLQKNLDELKDKCREAVSRFTEMEAQYVGLNPHIMQYCKTAMQVHCADEGKNDDDSDMMDCLIAHKNEPDVKASNKCRVSIEHFQIISLKDYHFTYKFKVACKSYAVRYCRDAKSKTAVVTCLSEKVLNDTISGLKSDIQKECRQQLRAQLFQQRESIEFDPKLKKACTDDIKLHCKDVEHGTAQVLECLQSTTSKLSDSCQREIFKIKKQEITDNAVDYALITMCADSIEQFCPHTEQEHVLDCLKKHKDEMGFSKKCRMVVIHRMIEQHSDYRLNPSLQENCKPDIKKFCLEKIAHVKPDVELNGEVIKCLKVAFKLSKLSNRCEKEMAIILRDQALNVRLNPLLRAVCKDELETICKVEGEDDSGNAEECLKNALLNHKIPTPQCQVEVASMIEESQADINVDPLLQQACSLDLLKYCSDVPQGKGRHISCLKIIMDDKSRQLLPECKSMLTKRFEMYKNAAKASIDDFQGLYSQVVTSPAKHYFFMVALMGIGLFFVIGMFCGRFTKRQLITKNK